MLSCSRSGLLRPIVANLLEPLLQIFLSKWPSPLIFHFFSALRILERPIKLLMPIAKSLAAQNDREGGQPRAIQSAYPFWLHFLLSQVSCRILGIPFLSRISKI